MWRARANGVDRTARPQCAMSCHSRERSIRTGFGRKRNGRFVAGPPNKLLFAKYGAYGLRIGVAKRNAEMLPLLGKLKRPSDWRQHDGCAAAR